MTKEIDSDVFTLNADLTFSESEQFKQNGTPGVYRGNGTYAVSGDSVLFSSSFVGQLGATITDRSMTMTGTGFTFVYVRQ